MKHAKFILFLGILITVTPFLGFPALWKNFIFGALGLLVILFAFRVMALLQDSSSSGEATHEDSEYNTLYPESVSADETMTAHEG